MSGFMSSTTTMTICKVNSTVNFTLDALKTHARTPDIDAGGRRLGWVALGDQLDTDGFELASVDGRYSDFSFRLDTRKVSGTVIRFQLSEAVREEIASGKKVGSERKKKLKEAITAKLTAKAEFVPSVIDCLWDAEKGRLLSARLRPRRYNRCWSCSRPHLAWTSHPSCLRKICRNFLPPSCAGKATPVEGNTLHPLGSVSLSAFEQVEEKSAVAVQNSLNAVAQALEEGMSIQKLHLVATSASEPDWQVDFTLDAFLTVSGLRFPKAEKGMEEDATFLLNADICL